MFRERQFKRRINRLDAQADHLEIVQLISNYDFPWDTTRALEFALFRTYAVPAIGNLLDATHEFGMRTQKRYDDTDLLISEIVEHGYDSERGLAAIRKMNGLHGHFKIANESMLYVLSTFVTEPTRWVGQFGYRKQSEKELQAWHRFWREVGTRMGIQDIPQDYWAMKTFSDAYERANYAFTEGGRRVADSTLDLFLSWYVPRSLFGALRPAMRSLMDDRLLDALHYAHPPRLLKAAVLGAMNVRKAVMAFWPLRTLPFLRTQRPGIVTYPHGYALAELGAVPEAGIDPKWLKHGEQATDAG